MKMIPTKTGVYKIGTYRRHGHDENKRFAVKYAGKAEGEDGIRGRVQDHLRGDGNKDIAEYLDDHKRNNLFVCWQVTKNAAKKEAEIIEGEDPPFNRRHEPKALKSKN